MNKNKKWLSTILFWLPMTGLAGEAITVWQQQIPARFSFWVQVVALLSTQLVAMQTYSRPNKDYSLIVQRIPLAILCVISLLQHWTPRPSVEALSLSLGLLTATMLMIIWIGEKHRNALLGCDKIAGNLSVATVWLLSIAYIDQIRLIVINGPGGVWWYTMYFSVLVAYSAQVVQGRETSNPYLIRGYCFAVIMCATVIVTALAVTML